MRVVAGHSSDCDARSLRQVLLGAGLTCDAADCVAWPHLSERLAQVDADLVLLHAPQDPQPALAALEEIKPLTRGRLLFAGSAADAGVQAQARQAGAALFLDADLLREQLDEALGSLRSAGSARGQVTAVYSPLPGSGGATVAVNLADALMAKAPRKTAVLETTRELGRVALMLETKGGRTMPQICARWASLDAISLAASAGEHAGGLKTLALGVDEERNDFFHRDSLRRVAVLARTAFAQSVLLLDHRLDEEEALVMRLADKTLMVIRPDVPSLRRARWALRRAEEQGVPRDRLALVINRWGQKGQLPRKEIETALGIKAVALIPDDPAKVNRAVNEGKTLRQLGGLSRISRRFQRLAGLVGAASR